MKDRSRIWQHIFGKGPGASRRRAAVLLGQFLIFMMICTLISQALYTGRMVQVTAGNSRSMSLNHVVEAEGTVQKGPESAVLVPAGMRIAQVLVREGQQVEAGETLFLLDCGDMEEQLSEKQEEEQRRRMQLESARENAKRQKEDAQKNRERANEDYNSAVDIGDRQVDEARAAWEKAGQEREQFADWERYLADVQQSDPGLRQLDEQIALLEQELNALREQAGKAESEPAGTVDETGNTGKEDQTDDTGNAETDGGTQAEPAGRETGPDPGDGKDTTGWAAQILAKEQELAQARAERESYLAQLSQNSRQQWEQTKAQLEESERQALRSYEGAQEGREQSVQAAARALEDASAKPASDSSLALLAMDVEQAKKECALLESLLETEGRICAQQAGQITQVSAQIGQRTTDAPVCLLAAAEGELTFQVMLTKEQIRFVNVGDECMVSFDSGKRKVEGLTVLSLSESREEPNRYELTLLLPAGQASMGQSGTVRLVQQTANYNTCVPLEALRVDSQQQTYVLVLSSTETFLGEQLTAVKRPVKVLDKNATYAALENGAVGAEEEIIISASGIVYEGDVVRMEEP